MHHYAMDGQLNIEGKKAQLVERKGYTVVGSQISCTYVVARFHCLRLSQFTHAMVYPVAYKDFE